MQYAADCFRFRRYVDNFDHKFGYIFSDIHHSNIRALIDEHVVVDDVAALAL